MLELRNIVKTYQTGDLVQNALKGVSISFRENEFVSILGQSGSGKTTMLNIIGGLDRYQSNSLEAPAQKRQKRSMSFLTALSLSFNNLRTKKAEPCLPPLPVPSVSSALPPDCITRYAVRGQINCMSRKKGCCKI